MRRTPILTLICLFLLLASAFGQQTSREPHNKPIVRNVLALFPTKATEVNGLCIALSHINTIYSNPLIFRTLPLINIRFRKKEGKR